MNDNELHYVDIDSDALWRDMMTIYQVNGGDTLMPGDEKEILLRAVQAMAINILCRVDNALRMDTLTYAQREFLKEYGLKRNCEYIDAIPATAPMTITMESTGNARTLEAGALMTADGITMWKTAEDLDITGTAQTIRTTIECATAGISGNGLAAGTEMQFMEGLEGLVSAIVSGNASGGTDAEDMEDYRERIRTYGLSTVTTGPAMQYEARARTVSSKIVDVKALEESNQVHVYCVLQAESEEYPAILQSVEQALSPGDVRPLTDRVLVSEAIEKAYTIHVKVWYSTYAALGSAVNEAVEEYQEWQDYKIGRAFDPYNLLSKLYNAGCDRVQFLEDSAGIDGGDMEYTAIAGNARCLGTITVEVVNT